jgi:tripartite-type tricarboxylate transporter receptor subunit TctC
MRTTKPNLARRALLGGSLAVAATGAATGAAIGPARAQAAWPTRAVTLVVPWPAGGSTDVSMRAMAEAAAKHLGQPVVVDNKPGASGTLGPATMAATARPDGYTIAQMPISMFRLPYMQKTSFDPQRDFTYISNLTGYTFGVVVKKDSKFHTLKDLIEAARANPGKITYATPGAGTTLHITMEQIAAAAGVKLTQVPFKGGAETSAAVMGGHVDATADSTGWGPLVDAGELRLLCTWGPSRTKKWPNVPNLVELGINIVSDSPFGIAGPRNMNPAAVQKLDAAFAAAMKDPAVLATLEKFDMAPRYMPTAEYKSFVETTITEQKALIERLGLKSS